MTVWQRRIETLGPWGAGIFLAIPALVAFYPPMSDLPYHEAAIGILRHFGDRSMLPKGLYRLNLGEPNQLFHMVGWALSYVMSTRWAVKLAVFATIVAIPASAARLARHVGASPLAALLVAPIAIGWLFYWGLIANLIGLAALLAVLPGLDRFAREPTRKGILASCGAVVLLYFAHEAMMFIYAAAAVSLALLHRWSPRRTALRLVPFAFAVAATLAQAKWQMRFMSPAVRAMPRLWTSLHTKLVGVPNLISPASEQYPRDAMFGLTAASIAALFWLRYRERRRRTADRRADDVSMSIAERVRGVVYTYRWELFATACLSAFLTFPVTLNGATFVYQRWFAPGFAVLAVVAAPRDIFVREGRVIRFAIAVSPVATLLLAWPAFAHSSRSYRSLEPLIPLVPPGSSLAALNLGPSDPTMTFSLGPAGGRILAERGGRLVYAFTDSAVSPVVLASRYEWNETLVRVGFESYAFRPAQDLYRFKYVLVRAADPALAMLVIRTMSDDAELVGAEDEWLLFKSRHQTVGVLARDFWLDGPPPENIQQRFDEIIAAAHAADGNQTALPGTAAACP
jgi:hypothetical protein